MGIIKWCILISTFVALSQQLHVLNGVSTPIHYDLEFILHTTQDSTFDGKADILLEIEYPLQNISLSSLSQIKEEKTSLVNDKGEFRPILHHLDDNKLFSTLVFPEELRQGIYTLHMEFSGSLKDYIEYRSESENREIIVVRFYNSSRMPRHIFPCWDSPTFRTTYSISIQHDPEYTAISYMPVNETIVSTNIDGKIWTRFERTPPLTTHNVAFAVFKNLEITHWEKNCFVWSRENIIPSLKLGYKSILRAISILESETGHPYPFPNVDVIVIPNGANYVPTHNKIGLITLRESEIMAFPNSSIARNFTIIRNAVQQVSHQWFGNLISARAWYTFSLLEGLRIHYENLVISKVIDEPEMMDFLSVVQKKKSFWTLRYYKKNYTSMEHFFVHDNQIAEIGEVIRGREATMMHMLRGSITEDVFKAGIKKLFQEYKFKNMDGKIFWTTMGKAINESSLLHKKMRERQEENTYWNYMAADNYPIMNMIRDYKTGTIELSIISSNETSASEIPINFVTSSSLNFSSTQTTHWWRCCGVLRITGVDPKDWVIFNIQATGFYRVMYDAENWRRITKYLNSDNYTNIHVLNRAALLQDASMLYGYGELKSYHPTLLNVTSYLSREKDYIPFVAILEWLDALRKPPGRYTRMEDYLSHLKEILEGPESEHVSTPNRNFTRKLCLAKLEMIQKKFHNDENKSGLKEQFDSALARIDI